MVSGASPRGGGVEGLLVPVLVSVPLFGLLLAAHAWIEASIFAGAAVLTVTTRAILARTHAPEERKNGRAQREFGRNALLDDSRAELE
ncbi:MULTISPECIES: hypothetical protein [unclassified Rathayibacter]|nr:MULTISPECIES: hypothetical protein [unclassified Rathayibacter]ROP49519.1 hypothetical protein EDF45_2073 [Rathayibacter sp. PhB186]ROS51987.1 hypothetical protein EDF44_2326 [Rathayibacter sp. PhB185]TCL82224.1 hypothetical protein EDF49_106234 [Rathayibacter sp. PhB192]TCM27440.1 hypothetical protein EDF43_106234 [Rathayibacter sp. PhB179]MCJ1673471.1 hypothetical protein [Rathayibacter sp. VKM Ac-2929]